MNIKLTRGAIASVEKAKEVEISSQEHLVQLEQYIRLYYFREDDRMTLFEKDLAKMAVIKFEPKGEHSYKIHGGGTRVKIEVDSKFGVITPKGWLIVPFYEDIENYHFPNGVAKIKINGQWGYITKAKNSDKLIAWS